MRMSSCGAFIAMYRTLHCKQCRRQLGRSCLFSSLQWAVLKLAAVTVKCVRTGECSHFDKWCDAPFEVPELSTEDISRYIDMQLVHDVDSIL